MIAKAKAVKESKAGARYKELEEKILYSSFKMI